MYRLMDRKINYFIIYFIQMTEKEKRHFSNQTKTKIEERISTKKTNTVVFKVKLENLWIEIGVGKVKKKLRNKEIHFVC